MPEHIGENDLGERYLDPSLDRAATMIVLSATMSSEGVVAPHVDDSLYASDLFIDNRKPRRIQTLSPHVLLLGGAFGPVLHAIQRSRLDVPREEEPEVDDLNPLPGSQDDGALS
jgi:hypothetical protein